MLAQAYTCAALLLLAIQCSAAPRYTWTPNITTNTTGSSLAASFVVEDQDLRIHKGAAHRPNALRKNGGRRLQEQQGINEELSCYRTVTETFASMDALASEYPNFVTLAVIGQSYLKTVDDTNGNNIRVMVLSAPLSSAAAPNNNNNKVNHVLIGGHHSRELPPPETLMRWAEFLLANYNKNADVTWLLERTNIHIVPFANPDGREIVQHHLDWSYRKNLNPTGACADETIVVNGVNARNGVDLNRNYPMFWGLDSGSSGDPCSTIYRGTAPLSEPESSAVYSYAKSLFPDEIKKGATAEEATLKLNESCPNTVEGMFIDVHSSGDFILFPWGVEDSVAPNHRSLLTMAAKLAFPGNYSLWGPQQSGFIYSVSGDATDTTYGVDCIPSFGYEIGSKFYANCSELEGIVVPQAFESFMIAAKAAKAPYMIALGPDILIINATETGRNTVRFEVKASDEDLIVEHAIFPDGVSKSQTIAQILLFVDVHPHDEQANGMPMDSKDEAFDSATEVAVLDLDTSGWEEASRHIIYFQATDSEGSVGAVSAIFVEKGIKRKESEGADTWNPATSSPETSNAELVASTGLVVLSLAAIAVIFA